MKQNWILKRAAIFIGVYLLLIIVSEFGGLKNGAQKHVKAVANFALSSFGNGGKVEFEDITKKADKVKYKDYDILVSMTSQQQLDRVMAKARLEGKKTTQIYPTSFGINSWVHFGMLFCFFIALLIALPATWKNRILLFITGFIFIDLYLIFKLWVSLNLKYSVRYEKFQVGWTNNFAIEALNHVSNIITFPFFGFLLVVIMSLLFFDKKALNNQASMPVLAVF